jgi:hypothetical protein
MTSDLAKLISDLVLLQNFFLFSKHVMVTSDLPYVIFDFIIVRYKIMCSSLCNQSLLLLLLIYVRKYQASK